MTLAQAFRKLLLGETWLLPIGIAVTVAVAVLVRSALGDEWRDVGGFVLLGGVAIALAASVARSARGR